MIQSSIALNFWLWWGIACILFILEVFMPGSFLLWVGMASFLTGMIVFLEPSLDLFSQGLIFGISTLLSLLIWYQYGQKKQTQNPPKHMNERAAQYLGRVFVLKEAIVKGQGVLIINDTRWKVLGEDMPAGTRVALESIDGTAFRVKKI